MCDIVDTALGRQADAMRRAYLGAWIRTRLAALRAAAAYLRARRPPVLTMAVAARHLRAATIAKGS